MHLTNCKETYLWICPGNTGVIDDGVKTNGHTVISFIFKFQKTKVSLTKVL